MYTASSSPSNIEAVIEALRQIQNRPELRTQLWANARALYQRLEADGYKICAPASPILAISMPNEEAAIRCWHELLMAGVYVNLALPPGTPGGAFLLRCSLSAAHTPDEVQQIADAFAEIAAANAPKIQQAGA
jgi:8-amino-7-oxononanoate synthase